MKTVCIVFALLFASTAMQGQYRCVTGFENWIVVREAAVVQYCYLDLKEGDIPPEVMMGVLVEEEFGPPGPGAWSAFCLLWGNGQKAIDALVMSGIYHANRLAYNQLIFWPNYDFM